jgi:ABC-type uncharacterized transport system ATPase subunit
MTTRRQVLLTPKIIKDVEKWVRPKQKIHTGRKIADGDKI